LEQYRRSWNSAGFIESSLDRNFADHPEEWIVPARFWLLIYRVRLKDVGESTLQMNSCSGLMVKVGGTVMCYFGHYPPDFRYLGTILRWR
jgi:hypothetical protein